MRDIRHILKTLLLVTTTFLLPTAQTSAQPTATRDTESCTRLIVPFAPSGITDLLGRIVADELAKLYGNPVVVENRAGASGHIGAQAVSKAAPDGCTLLVGTIGIHAAHKAYKKLSYDPQKELQPVTIIGESPNLVLVPENSQFNTIEEFLAFEKAHPNTLNYAMAGLGSSTHMVVALYEQLYKTKVNYVPYKGSGPALIDLIAGRVDVMFDNMPTGYPHVKSQRLKPLAITSRERHPILPNIPTLAESGIPGYEGTSWFTVSVHADVPAEKVEKLNKDLRTVLSKPEVKDKLGELGVSIVANTHKQAQAFVESETEKWTKVIEDSGLKLD
jgi:tripartite-type tricarboxylate transporter receptor subunit TctC